MCLMPDAPEMPRSSPPPTRNAEALASPYPDAEEAGLSRLRVGNRSNKARATGTASGAGDSAGGTSLTIPGTKRVPTAPPRGTAV